MEFSFPHTVRTLVPAEAFTVQVHAQVDEEGFTELGFEVPVGISAEAFSRLALHYYHLVDRARVLARERRVEIAHERREAGIAGTESGEEAS